MTQEPNTSVAGKYRLLRLLGQGGMGSVHEAVQESTGRHVALKLLNPRFLGGEDSEANKLTARFEREARAMAALHSENVVQILDAGRDDQLGHFMVMEYLRGRDLSQLLRKEGPLPVDLALKIMAQASAGLAQAHARGIIHRDIKPANIFLHETQDGLVRVKILDFGIARTQPTVDPSGATDDEPLTQLTQTGVMMGSPQYMSPEQARGLKELDPRADVWSLGVVLYRMLCGHIPHQQSQDSGLGDLLIAICVQPAPPLQDAAPWVPPAAAELVHRTLKIPPAERFSSAGELHQALLSLLPQGTLIRTEELRGISSEEQSLAAPRSQSLGLSPRSLDLPSESAMPSVAQVLQRPAPGRQAPFLAALGLILILCFGVGFGLASRHSSGARIPSASAAPAAASSSEDRQVVVLVAPAGVTVEVEGQPSPVGDDGGVILRGPLGSTRHLRLRQGDHEALFTVAISSQGAVPPRLVLKAPEPPASASVAPAAQPAPLPTFFPKARNPAAKPTAASPPASPQGALIKDFE
ncbi:MAG: serine/threonine protein kinase [Polyangiaceae bacterium]|jgi:serine/threonine-protein kinase|nr:serine/threonine protein kinase [Polyangiaceae bacterium]